MSKLERDTGLEKGNRLSRQGPEWTVDRATRKDTILNCSFFHHNLRPIWHVVLFGTEAKHKDSFAD